MTINDVVPVIEAVKVCGDVNRSFCGVYAGDVLSRAMKRIERDNVWVTVTSNVNVVAVAVLTEPSAVVIAENVPVSPEMLEKAEANGVTVLSSSLSVYEICARIHRISGL